MCHLNQLSLPAPILSWIEVVDFAWSNKSALNGIIIYFVLLYFQLLLDVPNNVKVKVEYHRTDLLSKSPSESATSAKYELDNNI